MSTRLMQRWYLPAAGRTGQSTQAVLYMEDDRASRTKSCLHQRTVRPTLQWAASLGDWLVTYPINRAGRGEPTDLSPAWRRQNRPNQAVTGEQVYVYVAAVKDIHASPVLRRVRGGGFDRIRQGAMTPTASSSFPLSSQQVVVKQRQPACICSSSTLHAPC
jgi:hypothetical protein